MNSDDRSSCIITGFLAAAFVAIIFLVSSCVQQRDALEFKRNEIVRIECIRQGGNWGVVSLPDRNIEYGCVKK